MAKKNYDQLSKDIVKYIGGEENDYSQASIPFAEVRQSPDG